MEAADGILEDLGNPDLYQRGDPEHYWQYLRNNDPVYWNPAGYHAGFWCITRYDDACRIFKDTENFSSEKGIMLGVNEGDGDAGGGKLLVVSDPPWHDKLRRALSGGFTPRAMRELKVNVEKTAVALVDEALERGSCDFVEEISSRLPNYIICSLLGVPRDDWELMYELTTAAMGFDDPEVRMHDSAKVARGRAHAEIIGYYMDLIDERRANPGSDLISTLTEAVIDGRPLTDKEIIVNCDGFIIGGNETTRNAISGGVQMLAQDSGQWHLLCADGALVSTAAEEIFRWTTPIMHSLRTAKNDVELHGKLIKRGDPVAIWTISANRDEDVFDAPGKFDITRDPNKHIAFAMGTHYCIGARLAQLEMHTLLQVLREKVRCISLDGPVKRSRSNVIRGIRQLPVSLTAR
ncbi:MAG TPA: cytochrome P450 [Streptosporangiaceae bacterium]|nr:cytochrome P450 [Streptosporangiaceae bacterium]